MIFKSRKKPLFNHCLFSSDHTVVIYSLVCGAEVSLIDVSVAAYKKLALKS